MKVLHLELTQIEAIEMLMLLNRALNAMDPQKWPAWVQPYLNALEEFLK